MSRDDLRSLIGLLLTCGAAVFCASALSGSSSRIVGTAGKVAVERDAQGLVLLSAKDATGIRYTVDGTAPTIWSARYSRPFLPEPDAYPARLIATPTSVQWRHPIGGFPNWVLLKARSFDETGRAGPVCTKALLPAITGALPVVSLVLEDGAFFDPDTGIYVVGNAVFLTGEGFVERYPRDQKWWKYPGNFHLRGRKAERSGHMECFAPGSSPDAPPLWSSDVALRINGNNTRGFPQHALRVIFDEALDVPLFGTARGKAFIRVLLRTAGNDQDHVFFRDALQHRICAGLPFETSGCVQSVLYVNGAYWGIHNLRERIDEQELARRYGIKPKDITIIEDRIALYEGKAEELSRFSRFLTLTEQWDASGRHFVDSLERSLDVGGFLSYMAAQIILANTDWPEQNVKWWRFTGTPDTLPGPRDGRWHLIMGDSDMGMGLVTPPGYDMFTHIDRHSTAPMARLFKACLRSPELEARFSGILEGQLNGALDQDHLLAAIDDMFAAVAGEMPRHIRRWRRPLTSETWLRHVEDLRTFARERPAVVKAHAKAYFNGHPIP